MARVSKKLENLNPQGFEVSRAQTGEWMNADDHQSEMENQKFLRWRHSFVDPTQKLTWYPFQIRL